MEPVGESADPAGAVGEPRPARGHVADGDTAHRFAAKIDVIVDANGVGAAVVAEDGRC